uniref:Uncharacterized protein n=1 Tax=Anguilla anguilla TaxID=7936 RepID=A0A0E9Q885_ANGAN
MQVPVSASSYLNILQNYHTRHHR